MHIPIINLNCPIVIYRKYTFLKITEVLLLKLKKLKY